MMSGKPKSSMRRMSDAPPDEAVILTAKKGDEQAFETLFKRHRQRIFAVALRYTRVREDAEDLVQLTFQKAFVYLHKFEGRSSFSTWLTRIAINEALMFLRRGRALREVSLDDSIRDEETATRPETAFGGPDPESSYLQKERTRILSAAMEQLGPGVRTVLELRELCELSNRETAGQVGLSVGAVKARVFHGRRKLREGLMVYLEPPRHSRRGISSVAKNIRHIAPERLGRQA
jgi:RNA polymerase sigma-70 factor (ECF subfamily)